MFPVDNKPGFCLAVNNAVYTSFEDLGLMAHYLVMADMRRLGCCRPGASMFPCRKAAATDGRISLVPLSKKETGKFLRSYERIRRAMIDFQLKGCR